MLETRKTVVVSVRMFASDFEEIRKQALFKRTHKSTLMREIIIDYLRREKENY